MPLEEAGGVTSTREEPPSISALIPAGFWVRVIAYAIDSVAVFVIYFILVFLFGVYLAATGDDLSDFGEQSFFFYAPILVRAAYETILVSKWATTVGKRFFGLYVIQADASVPASADSGAGHSMPVGNTFPDSRLRVDFGRAFKRHLATYLSGLILGIGFLQVAFRADKLAWHDQINGTKVVRLNRRQTSR